MKCENCIFNNKKITRLENINSCGINITKPKINCEFFTTKVKSMSDTNQRKLKTKKKMRLKK